MMEQLQRVLEEGEQLQRSFPYELPETGISGWASDLSAPLRNVKGEIIGIVGLIREITRRKKREDRIRESEEKFRLLVQALQEGIWTIDRDGYTTMVNPKMAEMLGYEVEEMAGVSVFSVIAPDSLEQAEKRIARGRNGIDDKFEINLQKKNGDTITALLGTSPLFDEEGRYNGSLGAVMDISDLKKARKELEEEKERAEESDRLKSAFLANMSHEIRTPLNAIIGFIDVVLLDVSFSHDVKESLENAKRSGNDLMRLMDDILDLAKLETGQVTPEIVPFSPATVLDNAAEKAKSLIGGSRKDIELTARVEKAEDIILRSDPKRLEQVLIYLIENAVKFTVAGNIEIGISAQEQEGTEIYVRDTGIGIPVEAQPHIFSPFRQADERVNREFSGLGLGLTIAHKLTALLGGTVRFESVPGEGTVFYVLLPYTEDNREGT
jgi:PAS domain S-box-containing protein